MYQDIRDIVSTTEADPKAGQWAFGLHFGWQLPCIYLQQIFLGIGHHVRSRKEVHLRPLTPPLPSNLKSHPFTCLLSSSPLWVRSSLNLGSPKLSSLLLADFFLVPMMSYRTLLPESSPGSIPVGGTPGPTLDPWTDVLWQRAKVA